MSIEKIESILFQNKTKDQLIEDTIASLSGLLADTFTGDDANALKNEFPEKTQLENIGIQLKSVAFFVNHKELEVPCIEVCIELVHEGLKIEIGSYSIIFNAECEQVDEILNLY